MAEVTGQVTTFDRPNFVGPLYQLSPTDTPLVTMLGGERGGQATQDKMFTWQTDDLKAPVATGLVEGAAPDYTLRTRGEVSNVVQIVYRGTELTYSALGNLGLLDTAAGGSNATAVLGDNPVTNEMARSLAHRLIEIKRSMEVSFLSGVFVDPATNGSARGSRGVIPAATTNLITLDAGAAAACDIAGARVTDGVNDATLGLPLGLSYVDNLLKDMFDNGAQLIQPVLFVNSFQKIKLSETYTLSGSLNIRSSTIGGMSVDSITTEFGELPIVLDRWMPTDQALIADLAYMKPRWFEVPGKGYLFIEDKPSDGSSVKQAIYGEFGLEYGPELMHGVIDNLLDA
jgi:hypothetical protein